MDCNETGILRLKKERVFDVQIQFYFYGILIAKDYYSSRACTILLLFIYSFPVLFDSHLHFHFIFLFSSTSSFSFLFFFFYFSLLLFFFSFLFSPIFFFMPLIGERASFHL